MLLQPIYFQANPQNPPSIRQDKPTLFSGALRFVSNGNSSAPSGPEKTRKMLAAMPERDKQLLSSFFRNLIVWNSAGYALESIKPMSLASFTAVDKNGKQSPLPTTPENCEMEAEWQVWERYKDRLPHPNFILVRMPNKRINHYYAPNLQALYLINKKAAFAKIQQHLPVFQEAIGRKLSEPEILKSLETVNPVSKAILDENELTIGILLGYGLKSARLYQRKEDTVITSMIQQIFREGRQMLGDIVGCDPADYSSIQGMPSLPACCPATYDEEPFQLMKAGLALHHKLKTLLNSPDFLEKTLAKLADDADCLNLTA